MIKKNQPLSFLNIGSYVFGTIVLHFQSSLPNINYGLILLPVFFMVIRYPKWINVCFFALGFFWANSYAHYHLENSPPVTTTQKVTGKIVSLVQVSAQKTTFNFLIENSNKNQKIVRLNWYQKVKKCRVGERWQLNIRLKKGRNFFNRGAFDYEYWLYAQGISAVGYIRSGHKISERQTLSLNAVREIIADKFNQTYQHSEYLGLLSALAFGEKSKITPLQWDILRNTGTSHLMAISGLHIGLVASLGFYFLFFLWRYLGSHKITSYQAGAMMAIICAAFYTALSGLSLPTQRAFIMVAIMMGSVLWCRNVSFQHSLMMALFIVLLIDPVAVGAAGFWLSFGAVFIIIYSMNGRLSMRSWWWKWGRIQWVLLIGLLPFSILFFHQAALISPFINIIAIPWVGFLVVPALLLGILFLPFTMLSESFLSLAEFNLSVLWQVFAWSYASFSQYKITFGFMSDWHFIFCMVAMWVLLLPKAMPGKIMAIIIFLPVIWVTFQPQQKKELWLTWFDVGQGLSIMVQTRDHVLLYDTGAVLGTFDIGERVLVPALAEMGISHLDTLLLSHADNDHAGGAKAIAKVMAIDRTMTGDKPALVMDFPQIIQCQAGQQWHWDGIAFLVLHPRLTIEKKTNNRSCVLLIRHPKVSILLTGDIEKKAEKQIIKAFPDLQADIISVPHHGSNTSSTSSFINQINPKIGLISSGYLNRYHFPKKKVVKRYGDLGTKLLNTADLGAITVKISAQGEMSWFYQKAKSKRYWHF